MWGHLTGILDGHHGKQVTEIPSLFTGSPKQLLGSLSSGLLACNTTPTWIGHPARHGSGARLGEGPGRDRQVLGSKLRPRGTWPRGPLRRSSRGWLRKRDASWLEKQRKMCLMDKSHSHSHHITSSHVLGMWWIPMVQDVSHS